MFFGSAMLAWDTHGEGTSGSLSSDSRKVVQLGGKCSSVIKARTGPSEFGGVVRWWVPLLALMGL